VCRPRNRSKKPIFAEADGELMGNLPATLEIVPEAVYLLIPPKARA
jgi:diacylglycerol kinase family enzyme